MQAQSKTHYYWLDLLRFLAAFIVLIGHARGSMFVAYPDLPADQKSIFVAIFFFITRSGGSAVIIFFVLSGYLVGGRAIKRLTDNTFLPLDYTIDRASRIMVPLIPALILTAAISWYMGEGLKFWVLIGNLLSLQRVVVPVYGRNGPLWSLGYEVWFYILMGTIGVAISTKFRKRWPLLLLLVVCAIFTKLDTVYLFCWLIGAYIYVAFPRKFSAPLFILSWCLVFYGLVAGQLGDGNIKLHSALLRHVILPENIALLIFSTGSALLIHELAQMRPHSQIAKKINIVGTKLADFSYTLYLTHFPILLLLAYLGFPRDRSIDLYSLTKYSAVICGCLIVAWLMYLPFERQTPRIRRTIKSYVSFLSQSKPDSSPTGPANA